GRHHGERGGAVADRDRHGAPGPGFGRLAHPARPVRHARGVRAGGDDADRQCVYDRTDGCIERRDVVSLGATPTEGSMAYTLEQLSADIRAALKADPGVGGKQAVCKLVSKVLEDKEFAARYLTADQCKPRKVLYEDPELGFCICGHVYEKPAHGQPHDHGSSWAIYGVAEGDTEMTDWPVVEKGGGASPTPGRPAAGRAARPGDPR